MNGLNQLRAVTGLRVALALLVGGASSTWAAEAAPSFTTVTSGARASITARDGDAMFNAEFFAGDDLTGPPVVSRLDPAVGGSGPGRSARWSATVTPKQTGVYPLGLRSLGAAELRIDGNRLARHEADHSDWSARTVVAVPMVAGKPYELVVESRLSGGQGKVALEWADPAPVPEAAQRPVRQELLAGPAVGGLIGEPRPRENSAYVLEPRPNGTVVLREKSSGAAAVFRGEFLVVHQPPGQEVKLDPKGGKYQDDGPVGDINYVVPSWEKETDFFTAAHPRTRLRATALMISGTKFQWILAAQPAFALAAELILPEGGEPPVLRFRLQAKAAGQFSVGFAGAPDVAPEAAEWIWQPLVWTGKRFPNRSYFTKEFQCPLPWVMTGVDGAAIGVGADPVEMPYRMPTISDSRFGVLVRNAAGAAQPLVFAPVLGGPGSALPAGGGSEFTLRLLVRRGPWFEAFKHLARTLYGLGDVRENGLCSLNTTIDNLMAFLLTDQYSYWFPRYKTWGYHNDGGPGAGRQQSAADAVSLALVTDHAGFFEKRARPTLEYFLSRNTVSTQFSQPKFMGGFVNNATDLVAAYRLTGGRTTVIRELLADRAFGADTGKKPPPSGRNQIHVARQELTAALAEYRLSGDRAALARARVAGDRYVALRVAQPVRDFRDAGSSFWSELAAAYDLLYELWQETADERYLRAAGAAMAEFTAYVYLVPVIPSGDFVAQPGGRYNHQPVPEEIVPAWRVSPNGLTAECAGTAHSHRGVYMASHPGYMARLAHDLGEPFFRDLARHAIVGRYANYPSYAYRNGFTTVHQQADYPLRPFEEIKKFTSAHYNHPLPMTAFLVDYLVGEAYQRSEGAIDFPSDYTNTGAFFRNRVYGARPGRFHGESGAFLWLPRGLVRTGSIQANYVAARGRGRLYLAFANQAAAELTIPFTVDPRRVALSGERRARTWIGSRPGPDLMVRDGSGTVTIPAKGQVSVAIEDVAVATEIQEAMLDPQSPPLSPSAAVRIPTEVGTVAATALRFGRDLTSVHVWTAAGPAEVARMTVLQGERTLAVSAEFPFEVTLPVEDGEAEFAVRVALARRDGRDVTVPVRLRLR
ncbi:MAG: hypothetical protein HZC55_05935 [Verrucomicrobia bacterium]|nr:hypothetical protein [Verrucomicrobiota bacterium]